MKNKNILFMFVCFLTFFAFKFNVLAADKTLIFDYENANIKSLVNDNLSIITELDDFINVNNTNNFYYSIYIRNGRYLTVALSNFTADFVWFAPQVDSYGVYLQSTMYGNYLTSFGRPDNFSWINVNNSYATNHYEMDLLNFTTANFNTLKSNILSFFNTPYDAGTGLISQIIGSLNYFSGSNYALFYKSSLPLKYVKNGTYGYDTDIYIVDTTYTYGSFIPTYYDYVSSQTPSISLSNLTSYTDNSDSIYKYSIDVDISNYDTNNYQYLYCLGTTCENLSSNDLTLDLYNNGTYIFKILNSNNEIVSSSSITISNISTITPRITIKDMTDYGNCFYHDTQICKQFSIFSSTADFSKYTLQYKINNENWLTYNASEELQNILTFYDNSIIIARLIENSSSVVVHSISFTITGIEQLQTQTPTIHIIDTGCIESNYQSNAGSSGLGHSSAGGRHDGDGGRRSVTTGNIKVKIYNYYSEDYKIYYSLDRANTFVEMSLTNTNVETTKTYQFAFYKTTNLIIKITDLNDNIITTSSYTFLMSCNEEYTTESIFDNINTFMNSMKGLFSKFTSIFKYFYDSLNDELKSFLVFLFSLIIIANLIYRMRR